MASEAASAASGTEAESEVFEVGLAPVGSYIVLALGADGRERTGVVESHRDNRMIVNLDGKIATTVEVGSEESWRLADLPDEPDFVPDDASSVSDQPCEPGDDAWEAPDEAPDEDEHATAIGSDDAAGAPSETGAGFAAAAAHGYSRRSRRPPERLAPTDDPRKRPLWYRKQLAAQKEQERRGLDDTEAERAADVSRRAPKRRARSRRKETADAEERPGSDGNTDADGGTEDGAGAEGGGRYQLRRAAVSSYADAASGGESDRAGASSDDGGAGSGDEGDDQSDADYAPRAADDGASSAGGSACGSEELARQLLNDEAVRSPARIPALYRAFDCARRAQCACVCDFACAVYAGGAAERRGVPLASRRGLGLRARRRDWACRRGLGPR